MSETRVYFIGNARTVKIGVASDPAQRLADLQVGNPRRLSVIAEMPGDERYERILHEHFAELRIRGEWFRHADRLAEFIAALPAMPTKMRAPSRVRSRSKQEPRRMPEALRVAVAKQWQEQLTLIAAAVRAFGVGRFAVLAETTVSHIESALHERGNRRWAAEWTLILRDVVPRETAHAILDKGMELSGFRLDANFQVVRDEQRAEAVRRLCV